MASGRSRGGARHAASASASAFTAPPTAPTTARPPASALPPLYDYTGSPMVAEGSECDPGRIGCGTFSAPVPTAVEPALAIGELHRFARSKGVTGTLRVAFFMGKVSPRGIDTTRSDTFLTLTLSTADHGANVMMQGAVVEIVATGAVDLREIDQLGPRCPLGRLVEVLKKNNVDVSPSTQFTLMHDARGVAAWSVRNPSSWALIADPTCTKLL